MANIFIVNHSISGPYAQCFSSYHKTEEEAASAYFDCKQSVGEDPALVELILLDTETLDATTICGWEGSAFDLEEEEAELEAELEAAPVSDVSALGGSAKLERRICRSSSRPSAVCSRTAVSEARERTRQSWTCFRMSSGTSTSTRRLPRTASTGQPVSC